MKGGDILTSPHGLSSTNDIIKRHLVEFNKVNQWIFRIWGKGVINVKRWDRGLSAPLILSLMQKLDKLFQLHSGHQVSPLTFLPLYLLLGESIEIKIYGKVLRITYLLARTSLDKESTFSQVLLSRPSLTFLINATKTLLAESVNKGDMYSIGLRVWRQLNLPVPITKILQFRG